MTILLNTALSAIAASQTLNTPYLLAELSYAGMAFMLAASAPAIGLWAIWTSDCLREYRRRKREPFQSTIISVTRCNATDYDATLRGWWLK